MIFGVSYILHLMQNRHGEVEEFGEETDRNEGRNLNTENSNLKVLITCNQKLVETEITQTLPFCLAVLFHLLFLTNISPLCQCKIAMLESNLCFLLYVAG